MPFSEISEIRPLNKGAFMGYYDDKRSGKTVGCQDECYIVKVEN